MKNKIPIIPIKTPINPPIIPIMPNKIYSPSPNENKSFKVFLDFAIASQIAYEPSLSGTADLVNISPIDVGSQIPRKDSASVIYIPAIDATQATPIVSRLTIVLVSRKSVSDNIASGIIVIIQKFLAGHAQA